MSQKEKYFWWFIAGMTSAIIWVFIIYITIKLEA